MKCSMGSLRCTVYTVHYIPYILHTITLLKTCTLAYTRGTYSYYVPSSSSNTANTSSHSSCCRCVRFQTVSAEEEGDLSMTSIEEFVFRISSSSGGPLEVLDFAAESPSEQMFPILDCVCIVLYCTLFVLFYSLALESVARD